MTDMPKEIKQPIEIIETEPKEIKLNWKCYEYIGTTVWKVGAEHIALTKEDDIKVGDKIHCYPTIMVVAKDENRLYAENDKYIAILEFAKDDRKCWVCGGIINKRGIAKGNKNTIVGQ